LRFFRVAALAHSQQAAGMKQLLLAACTAFFLLHDTGLAGEQRKRELLYELTHDFDKDGRKDRAAIILVGPGRTDFGEQSKERYGLSEGETVELAIYMGEGDKPFDLAMKPSAMLTAFPDTANLRWVLPLEANIQDSLIYSATSGWGATNMTAESLFISHRGGELVVSGYSQAWDMRESSGLCDVNFLTGKAEVRHGGLEGPAKPLKGKFKLVHLADWTAAMRPEACDKAMQQH
jgi:hypothetical protein